MIEREKKTGRRKDGKTGSLSPYFGDGVEYANMLMC
jgi:hypothetical protein